LYLIGKYHAPEDVWSVEIWDSEELETLVTRGTFEIIEGTPRYTRLCAIEDADVALGIRGYKKLGRNLKIW